MKNPADLPAPSIGRSLVPALVTTVLSVLTVVGGSVYAEVSLKEGRFRGDFEGPWNVLFVEGMHPFGYTGLILDGDGFGPLFSNSIGYFIVGLGVMAVVVFLVTLLFLGALVPGHSVLAAWGGAWFATIVGGATGALGVHVARVIGDDAPTSGYGLWMAARQWFSTGAYWGLVLGWLIGAVVLIFWVAQRRSSRRTPATTHQAGPGSSPYPAMGPGSSPYPSSGPGGSPQGSTPAAPNRAGHDPAPGAYDDPRGPGSSETLGDSPDRPAR